MVLHVSCLLSVSRSYFNEAKLAPRQHRTVLISFIISVCFLATLFSYPHFQFHWRQPSNPWTIKMRCRNIWQQVKIEVLSRLCDTNRNSHQGCRWLVLLWGVRQRQCQNTGSNDFKAGDEEQWRFCQYHEIINKKLQGEAGSGSESGSQPCSLSIHTIWWLMSSKLFLLSM